MPSLWDIFLTLVGFLPQVFLLYFVLSCIAESGLLRRKTVLPVLLGFGCTTLAVCSLAGIKDERTRKRMAVLLSFIPCSAMLPLLMLLLSAALHVSFLWVFAVYALSITAGLLLTYFVERSSRPRLGVLQQDHSPCDPQGQPCVSCAKAPKGSVATVLWAALKQSAWQTLLFTKKIFIAFAVSAFAITVLARFTFDFHYTAQPENSILFYICGVLSPIFAPVGLNNPAIICALLFGLIAKESAVSVLLLFPQIVGGMPAAAAVSLIIFYTLYPVCLSCCMAVSAHCGRRTMPKLFAVKTAAAYIFSFITYTICVTILL